MNVQQPIQQQSPNIVNDPLLAQLQNIDINTDIALHMTGSNVMSTDGTTDNTERSTNNRSISDAGLYGIPFLQPIPTGRAQTAPTQSDNFYGFNYPYMFYPYEGGTNNNNNIIGHQVPSASLDNNYIPFVPISTSGGSFHPNLVFPDNSNVPNNSPVPGEKLPTQTPVAANGNFGQQVVNPGAIPQRPTVPYQGGLLQIPQGPYLYMPSVTPPLQNPGSTTPRTSSSPNLHQYQLASVSESPEKDYHNSANENPAGSGSSKPAFEDPLRVSVESNDSSVHSWHPIQTAGINYPGLPHQVFHLSPNKEGQQPFSMPPQISEQGVPPTPLQYSPVYWNQGSVPVLPYQPFHYPPPGYFQVPTVDVSNSRQMYVSRQKQILNSLRYECVKTKLDIANCKEEIKELEQKLKDRKDLPSIKQLEDEIGELRTECLCLSREVDLYSEEKALLGEISDDFYDTLNTGQRGPLLPEAKQASKKPPARPPRFSKNKSKQISKQEDEENSESSKWLCTECTFRNHPLLSECEICNQPRKSKNKSSNRDS